MIFVSGQVARGPSGEVRHPGDLARQTTDVMEHVGRILSEHGATFDDVVKINSYYVDGGRGDAWRRSVDACRAFFRAPGPVVTGIPLRWLPDGLLIKTEVIAMLGEDGRDARAAEPAESGAPIRARAGAFQPGPAVRRHDLRERPGVDGREGRGARSRRARPPDPHRHGKGPEPARRVRSVDGRGGQGQRVLQERRDGGGAE